MHPVEDPEKKKNKKGQFVDEPAQLSQSAFLISGVDYPGKAG